MKHLSNSDVTGGMNAVYDFLLFLKIKMLITIKTLSTFCFIYLNL